MLKKLSMILIGAGILMAKVDKVKNEVSPTLKPVVKSATNVNANVDTKSWTPLLTEDFEAGIPGDWQVIDGNGDGVMWVAGTTGDLGGNDPPDYGTQYAYYSDDDAGSGSPQTPGEELISPSVDASSYTQVKIKYAWGYRDIGSNDWYKVEYSTDGGSTWNLINEYTADGSGWDSIVVSGSYSDVKVRFVYYETGQTWAWACAADNVSIEGWQSLTHDVGVTAVSPSGTGLPGGINVVVTVGNFGLNDETFPVYVDIVGPNSGSFDTTVTLASGGTMDIDFGTFNFVEGDYTITAYTALTGDQYTGNDTMEVNYCAFVTGQVIKSWDVQALTGDNHCLGVEFLNGYLIVSGGNSGSDPNKVYVIDTTGSGSLVYTFDQPSWSTSWGWRDLCSDQYDTLYASVNNNVDVFVIDFSGGTMNVVYSFAGPENPNRALAYRPSDGHFFTANWSGPLYEFDKTNSNINSWSNPGYDMYGACYDTVTSHVWWFAQEMNSYGWYGKIYEFDPTTGTFTGNEIEFSGPSGGYAGGIDLEYNVDGYDVFFALAQTTTDQVYMVALRSVTGIEERHERQIVSGIKVSSISKGKVSIRFVLPYKAKVKVNVYDISGRIILSKNLGKLASGNHKLTLGNLSKSGLYIVEVN
ncbi:MAG TPA: hypothetical protein ENG29_01895, partial [Firmicutes bacterium]|nr:hypothetical protein [Bacillota bacterium]